MEADCEECSTLEQSIYWAHFQSIHFCQILDSDFRSQLMIPKKFSDYARGRLQDKVTLKGPGGTTTWEVGLTASGDMLFLRDGWSEFVNAFSLEENDILIFKYSGNSSFSILIFDRQSLCEKESSYFIKKCGHSKTGHRSKEKGFLKEVLKEFAQEYSHDEFELTPTKKPRKDADEQNPSSPEQCIASDVPGMSLVKAPCIDVEAAEQQKPRKDTDEQNLSSPEQCIASDVPKMSHMKALYIDVDAVEERPTNEQNSWSWESVELPLVAGKLKPPKKDPSINVAACVFQRAVTEEQKQATVFMASKELTKDSFLAVMRPTSVYRVFYLNIPAAWISQHITFKNQLVWLRRNKKTWPTKLLCRPNGRAGLSLGWKAFALDNYLEEFDVCVFKPANLKHEPVTLDVDIFRVVPDAVKSTRVPPASTQKFSGVGCREVA